MADDQTIRELETTDDYLAQLISFLNNRVEAIENDPTTINSAIQSLVTRMDALQNMHENTLIIVGIWGALFGIIIAIGIGAASYLIITQRQEMQKQQEKEMIEMETRLMQKQQRIMEDMLANKTSGEPTKIRKPNDKGNP